jgi:hypothetical protein
LLFESSEDDDEDEDEPEYEGYLASHEINELSVRRDRGSVGEGMIVLLLSCVVRDSVDRVSFDECSGTVEGALGGGSTEQLALRGLPSCRGVWGPGWEPVSGCGTALSHRLRFGMLLKGSKEVVRLL